MRIMDETQRGKVATARPILRSIKAGIFSMSEIGTRFHRDHLKMAYVYIYTYNKCQRTRDQKGSYKLDQIGTFQQICLESYLGYKSKVIV